MLDALRVLSALRMLGALRAAQGRALRKKEEAGEALGEEEWKEWLRLGMQLQQMGEQMPLDHHEWFKVRGSDAGIGCRDQMQGSGAF